MNPGVTEEIGKTTRSFFETMKDHPAVLVLALCNLALIVFMYFALSAAAQFRTDLIKQSFEYQKQAAELLARCVLQPQQRSEYKLQDFESVPYPMPRPPDAPE
jgi:hypothetical protein